MAIEVEKKALLSEEAYQQLPEQILALGGQDAGNQDTDSIFYVTDGAQVKLQATPASGKAKLAWKSGDYDDGAAARREIEVQLAPSEFEAAEQFIDALLTGVKKVPTTQKRHNYELDGVAIAVKYSEHWGYHVELDQEVPTEEGVVIAEERIQQVADKLNMTLLTSEQEKQLVAEMLKKV